MTQRGKGNSWKSEPRLEGKKKKKINEGSQGSTNSFAKHNHEKLPAMEENREETNFEKRRKVHLS